MLLGLGKPRFALVDVDGFGTIGVRSVAEAKQRSRNARYYDRAGAMTAEFGLSKLHQIIDQVCDPEGAAMFCDDDISELSEIDSALITKLVDVIETFNEWGPAKNEGGGSSNS